MAVIDLTLNSFKVPAIDGYTPPFGTMVTRTEANKGGLSTVEVNSNIIMPFVNMRPKVITENSSTTEIEYDAKLCFSASLLAGVTLELDDGDYEGCRVQITNLSAYTCAVNYGSSTIVSVQTGANVEVIWTGSSWMLYTTGTIASGNVMAPTSAAVQAAIANENILSDFEAVTLSTDSSNPTIMQYDGMLFITQSWSSSMAVGIYINGNRVSYAGGNNMSVSQMVVFKKGDAIYLSVVGSGVQEFARYYTNRDYSSRT